MSLDSVLPASRAWSEQWPLVGVAERVIGPQRRPLESLLTALSALKLAVVGSPVWGHLETMEALCGASRTTRASISGT